MSALSDTHWAPFWMIYNTPDRTWLVVNLNY